MGKINPNVSERNKYRINKHRFLELYHYCLQYEDWKRERAGISFMQSPDITAPISGGSSASDRTERAAIRRDALDRKIRSIEEAAREAAEGNAVLTPCILRAVTEGATADELIAQGMPCCRDSFYTMRRRFYWILDRRLLNG